ncbi:MAG: ABC transporter ATP-binding protein [Acetatifactor sp.]|nr:ABC transporter ATP-binding protein [Acetatifactor sp.]
MSNLAIDIQHLTKTYGKNRGVSDLTLQVNEGEIFGFLGPNGAGKSTTIRSMLGLIRYQSGSVQLLGSDLATNKEALLREIGYLPSEVMYYPSMKGIDVIKYAASMRGMDCSEEAAKLCERLKIDTEKRIEELSLGNRKKIGIVCAMQHKPKLLIFDEPTSGLDPLMQAEFFKLVTEYNAQGTTCFLSSHVLSEIKKYCERVAIIREGHLIKTDTVENLLSSQGKIVKVFVDGEYSTFRHAGTIPELLQQLEGKNITDLEITEPDIEDIFMSFYEEDNK